MTLLPKLTLWTVTAQENQPVARPEELLGLGCLPWGKRYGNHEHKSLRAQPLRRGGWVYHAGLSGSQTPGVRWPPEQVQSECRGLDSSSPSLGQVTGAGTAVPWPGAESQPQTAGRSAVQPSRPGRATFREHGGEAREGSPRLLPDFKCEAFRRLEPGSKTDAEQTCNSTARLPTIGAAGSFWPLLRLVSREGLYSQEPEGVLSDRV